MFLLGYDIGSSSVKAALINAETGQMMKATQFPETELDIVSQQVGWAEQDPEVWWDSLCRATRQLLHQTQVEPYHIKGIGIAYQMHGLVVIDKDKEVLRPAIIWCDSRAVTIGREAFDALTKEKCLSHLLNSPGNFTASKLKWVKDNEPDIYKRIHKILLPGDYIAMKLSGEVNTTLPGLSEGMFWDFKTNQVAQFLLDYYGISQELIPNTVPTFGLHGTLTKDAAAATGLAEGTPITYRAGDQPNNAFSLGVLDPGQVAATGGTSGVVYGVVDELLYDDLSRINSFAHVNHTYEHPRLGLLLCINGAGIQYAWLKKQIAQPGISYADMEQVVNTVPTGADGLRIIPFGNGAERILSNKNPGAQINNLHFNRHTRAHFYRAALEGIAFSFVYGFQILKELGLNPKHIKVGNDNLFQSKTFSTTIANLLSCRIEVVQTSGAEGAAKASGLGAGIYSHLDEALKTNNIQQQYFPNSANGMYRQAFDAWKNDLEKLTALPSDF